MPASILSSKSGGSLEGLVPLISSNVFALGGGILAAV